jgi:hypothetical protein
MNDNKIVMKNNGNVVKLNVLEERIGNMIAENAEAHEIIFQKMETFENNHLMHIEKRLSSIENKLYFAAGAFMIIEIVLRYIFR